MKILLVKRGALGDILMTTPLIRQLRQAQPQAQINYCVANSCAAALRLNPYLNQVLTVEDSFFSSRGSWQLLKYIYTLRNHYDYIFILGKNWLINYLFKLANANLIGFARERQSRLVLNQWVEYADVKRYQGYYYLDLLLAAGLSSSIDYSDCSLDLVVAADRQVADELLARLNFKQFVVVTNSGGNNQFEQASGIRMLPDNKILPLLSRLLEQQPVLLLGGQVDQANYQRYCRLLNDPSQLINLAGNLSIAASCHLLTKARHFYTTDCGAMHFGLAAGVARNMTCLFGPTNPAHILPPDCACKIVWQDQDIFNDDYQLYGKAKPGDFFAKLDIDQLIPG